MDTEKEKKILRYISIGIFLISLTQRTYCTKNNCGNLGDGFYCFTVGWLGLLVGEAYISWLANPILIIAWMLNLKSQITSIILSGLSTFFSLSFLYFDKIMIDEAGHYETITGYRIGYWLWMLSSFILFIGNLWIKFKPKKEYNSH